MAELYLVEFKGHRREYCSNAFHHKLKRNAAVIVENDSGEEFGWALHRWNEEKPPKQKGAPARILRNASEEDISTYRQLRPKESAAKSLARNVAQKLSLKMKLSDVEIQFDGSKMTFYYTADGRVDFREMVKELAGTYRTWIEMRQISPREETRRIGDCGMCGGEVCCRRANLQNIQIATQDARDQDLQMNMSKLTGLCGKLRCCLSFEKQQYMDVKGMFPGKGSRVNTPAGNGVIQRVDVFNEEAWVKLEDGERIRVSPDQVRKLERHERGSRQHQNDDNETNGVAVTNGDYENNSEDYSAYEDRQS